METTKQYYRVDRRDIHRFRTTLESYDGMAVVRTLDPGRGLMEVSVAPGCERLVREAVQGLGRDRGPRALQCGPGGNIARENNEHAERNRMRFFISTMGCQMNEYDSDYAARRLVQDGMLPAGRPEEADILIVNTCSVREKAEQKAVSTLGRMARLKGRGRARVLVIMGCVAQQEGEELLGRFPELDLVVGAREAHRTADLVTRVLETGERMTAVELERPPMTAPPAAGAEECFKGRVKGFITIMQGCNNFCSYCIVPYVRGREAGRSPRDILEETEGLVAAGVREITLLGQNVNSYRWEEEGRMVDFAGLLRIMAGELEGRLARLRFTTSHPKDLTRDLIGCFQELDLLCPHIHLPFQAGSNRILRLMNRGYTRGYYMDLVASLREACPGIAVTSDVMVGFPGETQEDFQATLDLIERVRFDNLYSFKYSDRKRTAAAAMDGKVPETEKWERLSELQALQKRITMEKNRALVGSETEVLVEGWSKKGGELSGRTPTNYVVNFPGERALVGRLVRVVVKEAKAHSLHGEAKGT